MRWLLLVAVCLPLAAAAAEDDSEKNAEAKAAEKAARVRDMAVRYRPSVVTVRFGLKTQPDGTRPDASLPYRCPACGNSRLHVTDSIEKDIPCLVAGFVLATNRVLVQDLDMRPQWLEGVEVVQGDEAVPARAVLRYPEENAVLLETARPLAGVCPLAFSGDATNAPSLFHVVTDADGRVQAGLRAIDRKFRHYPATDADWCASTPNTIVVDASNRAVSVQMRLDRRLEEAVPRPPEEWRSEPAEAKEERLAALEKRLSSSFLPVYLHIDEEKKPERERFSFVSYDSGEQKLSGDVDTIGLVLADGDVLIPLDLDSGKVAALDRMEATLPDGRKAPLEFAGAFAEYGLFLLRFADGRIPEGVEPAAFADTTPEEWIRRPAYLVHPRNRNGTLKLSLAPRVVRGCRRVHGGAVVPDVARDGNGEYLLSESGAVMALGGRVRMAGESWRARTVIPGGTLARLVAAREFDLEFAVRKGKARIRVAWIGVETQPMTKELAREKKAQGFLSAELGSGSLVGKVYPGTPAARAGVKEGDVLLWVRRAASKRREKLETRDIRSFGMDMDRFLDRLPLSMFDRLGVTPPWPQVEGGVNEVFTKLGIGAKVVLAWVSGGEKREAEIVLEQAPIHYRTARRIRNRTLGLVAADLTFEVRAYLKLKDDAPGVVITKMQDGSPSAVAGLRPFEVITAVNGEDVPTALRFSELIKGRKDLTLSVRRLDSTRVVRIQLKETR